MAFSHGVNKTQVITVAATHTNTALTHPDYDVYEFNNAGTAVVCVEWSVSGGSAVTSTMTTSYPILPGQCKTLQRPQGATHLANIAASAGQTLYVTAGKGE